MNILRILVVIGVSCGLLFFVTLDVKAGNRLTKEESIAAGKTLFETKNCSICHSLQGIKNSIGSDLLRWRNLESPMFWAAIMWNHVPEMAMALDNGVLDYPTFENDEFANIVVYINSFADNIERFQFKANKNRGKFLFNYLGCAKCHTIRNRGGSVGPNLTYVAKQLITTMCLPVSYYRTQYL